MLKRRALAYAHIDNKAAFHRHRAALAATARASRQQRIKTTRSGSRLMRGLPAGLTQAHQRLLRVAFSFPPSPARTHAATLHALSSAPFSHSSVRTSPLSGSCRRGGGLRNRWAAYTPADNARPARTPLSACSRIRILRLRFFSREYQRIRIGGRAIWCHRFAHSRTLVLLRTILRRLRVKTYRSAYEHRASRGCRARITRRTTLRRCA